MWEVGDEVVTRYGNTLTLVDKIYGGSRGKRSYFLATCNVCTPDKELFPEDYFKVNSTALRRNGSPCGCAMSRLWSLEQYGVIVKRYCKTKDYVFNGFVPSEKYLGKKSLCRLSCNKHKVSWVGDVGRLLTGNTSCPECGKESTLAAHLKGDDFHIREFYATGKFEGFTFTKNKTKKTKDGRFSFWDYTCDKCSNDEFVEAGVCSGIFTSNSGHLKQGKKGCRCSKVNKFSKEQREFMVRYYCEENGLSFVDWMEDYRGADTLVKVLCREGHDMVKSTQAILGGNGCVTCRQNTLGYYHSRREDQDTLYFIRFTCHTTEETFIKVGRSFNVRSRYNEYKSSGYVTEVISEQNSLHKFVYKAEKKVHNILDEFHYRPNYHFDGAAEECFKGCDDNYVQKVIDETLVQ